MFDKLQIFLKFNRLIEPTTSNAVVYYHFTIANEELKEVLTTFKSLVESSIYNAEMPSCGSTDHFRSTPRTPVHI